jgi:hypothetical protein
MPQEHLSLSSFQVLSADQYLPMCRILKLSRAVGQYFNDEIKRQVRRRVVSRSRAVISIVAIDQVGFSCGHVTMALNLNRSAISKLVLRARNDQTLKNGVKDGLNLY